MSSHDLRSQSGPDAAAVSRLCDLGLSVIALCGPGCDGAKHGRAGHPPNMSGKIPMSAAWQRSGYRPAAALLQEWRPGCNVGVLCGLQPAAPGAREPAGVAVVDGDGPEALAWMRANLPPTPVRDTTRRGEHWYYRARGPVRNRNLRHCTPRLELEVLGNGRQVVVPPSVHASGHAYAEVERWTPELLAAMPDYDPAWFAGFAAGGPATAGGGPGAADGRSWAADPAPPPAGGGPVLGGGSWPGERAFTRAEYARSFERALAYLQSPRCPPSVSGRDGHGALYSAAVKALRGFPLASWERMASMPGDEAHPVDAEDAAHEAFRLLQHAFNPRCLAADGQTPYPWSPAELWHKVESAAAADRLPGPDYWLYDAKPGSRRAADARVRDDAAGGLAEVAAGGAEEEGAGSTFEEVFALVLPDPPGVAGAAGVQGAAETPDDTMAREGEDRAAAPAEAAVSAAAGVAGGCPVGGAAAEAPAPPKPKKSPFSDAKSADGEKDEEQGQEDETEGGEIRIEIDHDTERMKAQAIEVLAGMEEVYVRGAVLCDLVKETGKDRWGQERRPWVRKTSKAFLKSKMNSAAFWYTKKVPRGEEAEEVEVRERSDAETVAAVLAAGHWPKVKRLEGIVYVPVLRKDGTILQEPEYDKKTGLYYHDELKDIGVVEKPTRTDVEKAKEYLFRVIADFPFEEPQVARAVWLSAVLTRFCRYSYKGLSPMFAVSARESSSGKSLLAECASIIADGRPVDMMPFTGDEGEAKREILALLSRDDTHAICLDNIKITLSSAAYEAMLTGSATVGREVGTSEVKRVVMSDAVWWATGNDLQIGPDMSRRCLLMKIYDRSGSPTQRRVSIDDLRTYCYDKRTWLVRACLVLLAGFTQAGAPQADHDCDGVPVADLASYGAWSDVVRQCVIWSGLPDPARALASRDAEVSSEKTASNGLVMHWLRAFGAAPVRASAAVAALNKDPARYAALLNYLADHGLDRVNTRTLGSFVKAHLAGIWTDESGKKYLLCFHKKAEGNFYSIREEK